MSHLRIQSRTPFHSPSAAPSPPCCAASTGILLVPSHCLTTSKAGQGVEETRLQPQRPTSSFLSVFKLKDCPVTQGLPSAKEEFHPALLGAGGGGQRGGQIKLGQASLHSQREGDWQRGSDLLATPLPVSSPCRRLTNLLTDSGSPETSQSFRTKQELMGAVPKQTPNSGSHLHPACPAPRAAPDRNSPAGPEQEKVKVNKRCLNLSLRLEQSEPTCNFIQTCGENNF